VNGGYSTNFNGWSVNPGGTWYRSNDAQTFQQVADGVTASISQQVCHVIDDLLLPFTAL
jgi:hypothetical protein